MTEPPSYQLIDFDAVPGVPCPCGTARRALADRADYPATLHRTEITANAKRHYHRRLTEVYYILQCERDARMQLNDDIVALKPGLAVFIPPGVRHRAIGRMTVLIFCLPKFDPADEVIVDE